MTNQKVSTMSKLNYLKKVALYLLAFVMIISFNETTVEAKGKTQLNTTSVTLTVGKKKTLKLKNYTKLSKKKIKKVKWSTSNKKVVSLKVSGKYKQNCKITAKKAGKATIKVKYNGKTYKCKVVVKKTSTKTTKPTTEIPAEDVDPEKPTNNKPETPTNPNKPGTTENTTEDTSVNTDANSTEKEHVCLENANYDFSGNTVVITCSICGKEIKETDDTKYANEVWETTPATCTTNEVKTLYNVYDDGTKEFIRSVETPNSALGHSWTYDYSEHHCPHVEVTCTSTCSRCGDSHSDTGKTYNQIKSDQYNGYTVFIDLRPNNYSDAWSKTYGTNNACKSEVICNHCKTVSSSTESHAAWELASTQITIWKNKGYTVILRSNSYGSDKSVDTIKSLVHEDWTK